MIWKAFTVADDGTIEKANVRLGGAGSYAMPATAT